MRAYNYTRIYLAIINAMSVNNLNQLGVVFLSWRAPKTLRASLQSFSENLSSELFADALVYGQELTQDDCDIANEFGFRAAGNQRNVGILAGMKQAVAATRADYILYLECDCALIASREKAANSLANSLHALSMNQIDVMRLRHLRYAGADYTPKKHIRYWPDSTGKETFVKKIRRFVRPYKARRLIGEACLLHSCAEKRFPAYIYRLNSGAYCMRSKYINWTNQSIMFKKDWFLNNIIPYAESNLSSRSVNGYPDLEKEMNCSWWRKQNFKVGWDDPGLFTHKRHDRPLGDEKLQC